MKPFADILSPGGGDNDPIYPLMAAVRSCRELQLPLLTAAAWHA
ncbi:hypothetical protein LINPERPRIM_LOCUS16720, partial [Linum perenne]